jgi:multiple sugar transport system substrate-binding protein
MFPGPLSTNYLNGHYYGLPLDTNTRVLVYNTDMFAAAGIAGPPDTIEDFLAACEMISALGEDKYCFADGGTYGWAVNPWIWSMGSDIVSPDMTVASGYLDGPGTQEAYEFLKDLLDNGYLHPGIVEGGLDVWGEFGNGNIGMILEGPWFPPYYSGDAPYDFALMPAGDGGPISVVGGQDIAIFRQSLNKEAAADFVRFMLREDIQLTMAEVGAVPVLLSALESDYVLNHEFFGYFLEQLQYSMARLPHPNWTKIEDVYKIAGAEYLLGEKTFEEALGAAATTIDGLLILEE